MRIPSHLVQLKTIRAEPIIAAMAAVAVGMFVGTWVIGPAITHQSTDASAPAVQDRITFEDMVARPDPMPYRAATPDFGKSGVPNYAAAARDKARGETGGQTADADVVPEPASRLPSHSRLPDRHRIY